jgi:hypothetical protein
MSHDPYKIKPPPVYEHNDATAENNSGKGNLYAVPGGVAGWSWGAFFWGLVWALFHRVRVVFWVLLPFAGVLWYDRFGKPLTAGQGVGRVVFLLACAVAVQVILGRKGREWAWQNKRWQGLGHFNQVQRWWNWSGIALFVPLISLTVWLFSSAAWQKIQYRHRLIGALNHGQMVAEKVGMYIEQHHRIPNSFAEAGTSATLPGLRLDVETARIRLSIEGGAVPGAGITLVPTFDVAGLVSWRCLADAGIRHHVREQCPYEGSESALIFPARIRTANAVRFTDQVTEAVVRYVNSNRRLPKNLADAGVNSALPEEISALLFNPADGNIAVTMATPPMQGQAYLLVPTLGKNGRITWQCLAHQIDWHYLPLQCRYLANPDYAKKPH